MKKQELKNFAIFMIVLLAIMFGTLAIAVTCKAQVDPYYNNVETEVTLDDFGFYETDSSVVNEVIFSVYNIIDMIYDPVYDEYIIEYDDPDAFDLDHLAWMSQDEESYKDGYMSIKVTKDIFFNIVDDLQYNRNTYLKYTLLEEQVKIDGSKFIKLHYSIVETKKHSA